MQVLASTFRYERLLVSDYLKGLLYSSAAEAWSFYFRSTVTFLKVAEIQEILIVTAKVKE